MNIGIIGCGLIGHKRAKSLGAARLMACADIDKSRADAFARNYPGCTAVSDWRHVLDNSQVNAVVVATPHDSLATITAAAIAYRKHVLVEKPAARHVSELNYLHKSAKDAGVQVRVGFNHRYHRAFRRARDLIDSGALGPLMFLRARYGHGGRVGYDTEWRAKPEISGGGELIDQGVHVIDLARWFLGDFSRVDGFAHTYYWNMPVDDNAFLLLRTPDDRAAFMHVSCTEWRNTFSFEIYGKLGKIHIDGLGGSYGTERLAFYKMSPEMGPPETVIHEYPMGDDSWAMEMAEFLRDIELKREPSPGLNDAAAALKIVDKIYRTSGYDHSA
ncbi:MAG: Gfo/Idh/MocA family protein [Rhodospirillaceae bacterium]